MTGSGSRTWPEIFSEQRPGLLRFLLQKLGNRELAEDLTQDVWVRIARGGCTIMPDNPAKYLYRIATNLAIDHLRRARHGIEVQADDARTEHVIAETVSPEDATIQRDQIERLRAVLDTLPPRSREIFMLALACMNSCPGTGKSHNSTAIPTLPKYTRGTPRMLTR